jgi:hypothetical protein
MPRAPRYVPADSMVEITSRTTGGALLLRPSPELNARILGIIARALVLYPIQLHAFVFLSNHWHALATVAHAERLSAFLRHVNGNVAKAAKELVGWSGSVWEQRPHVIPVVDDEAAEGRLAYILAHGTKEGLVANPLDWPGVSSARALAYGESLSGTWRHRTRRRGAKGDAAARDFDSVYEIELTPLPAWAHVPVEERRGRVRSMIASTMEQHRSRNHVGVAAVLSQEPRAVPATFVRRPAPQVHASRPDSRENFLEARAAFLVAYHDAKALTQRPALDLASKYPAGALPPRPPMSPRAARPPTTVAGHEPRLAS